LPERHGILRVCPRVGPGEFTISPCAAPARALRNHDLARRAIVADGSDVEDPQPGLEVPLNHDVQDDDALAVGDGDITVVVVNIVAPEVTCTLTTVLRLSWMPAPSVPSLT